jgi:hypothetical protein
VRFLATTGRERDRRQLADLGLLVDPAVLVATEELEADAPLRRVFHHGLLAALDAVLHVLGDLQGGGLGGDAGSLSRTAISS